MANVRKTKKINEIISKYKMEIRAEKLTTVNAITKDSELAKKIVNWIDCSKHVEKDFVSFSSSSYDDWDCSITFYCGKKPKDLQYCYFQGSYKVSKEMFEFLKNYNENDLNAKKEMTTWWNGLVDLANKKEQAKKMKKDIQLEFDGEITFKEINDKYGKDYYVKETDTKISFHKITDPTHYKSVPEFTIKIKPARQDCDEKQHYMSVYNKKEFDEAMKHAIRTIEVPNDLIKYALSYGVTINANKKNEFVLRYSYDGTNNRWYTSYKAILPSNATNDGIKKAIKTFGEKREKRIH